MFQSKNMNKVNGSTHKLESFGDWIRIKELGSGGFGEVLLWKNRHTNQMIATKRCLKDASSLLLDEITKLKDRWRKENELLKNLKTENIVQGVEVDSDFIKYLDSSHAWNLPVLIMEYCDGGDLRQEMQKKENLNGLRECDVREIMRSLRKAVSYLHDKFAITHRDIKPENIVLRKCNGKNKTIYKLTDLGLARNISSDTIAASVVGTKHYFAPEILDSAKYTKTVDYWSLGIIAFEIICGVYPFIPHQSLYQIIHNIKKKDRNCIAITETADPPNNFVFHNEIFKELRSSGVFKSKMEIWLRLALDSNYSNRGYHINIPTPNENALEQIPRRVLTFFSELDAALDSKILTFFCLNTYQFLDYEVNENLKMIELTQSLESDTGIARRNFYFIFPTGHPKPQLSSRTKPIDLFIPDFDPDDESVVMVYLLGFRHSFTPRDLRISPRIQETLQLHSKCTVQCQNWVADEFLLHTKFLLQNEQHHLNTFITGLLQYTLNLENEIFHYEENVRSEMEQILIAKGSVRQFHSMINIGKDIFIKNKICFDEYENLSHKLKDEIAKIEQVVQRNISARMRSALRRIQEQVKNPYFPAIIKKDIYKISEMEDIFNEAKRKNNMNDVISKCKQCIYSCLEERKNFLASKDLESSKQFIDDVHDEFRKIKEIIASAKQLVTALEKKISDYTRQYQKKLHEIFVSSQQNLSLQMSSLKSNEFSNQNLGSDSLNGSSYNQPLALDLIKEANDCIELFNSIGDLNEDLNTVYPTTINN